MLQARKAKRQQKKFKGGLVGPSGSGKTWSALEIATGLKGEGRILLLDTERSSSTLYADKFDFDIIDLPDGEVKTYLAGLEYGEKNGYSVVVIDSLSHAWERLVEEADHVAKRSKSGNTFQAWAEVTPIYKKLVEGIVSCGCHVIATMRAKTDYVMEEYTDSAGRKKTRPKKVGLAPVFRQGGEYEFDLIGTIDLEHELIVEKSRINFLADAVIKKPDSSLGEKLRDWLNEGEVEVPIEPAALPDEYVIETDCGMKGKSLALIREEFPGWLGKALIDPKRKAALTKRDQVNIKAYMEANP